VPLKTGVKRSMASPEAMRPGFARIPRYAERIRYLIYLIIMLLVKITLEMA